jgi:CheY-like chemotaxis protein
MPKILVVEDMPDSAEMAAQILRNYGHEVYVAANGEEGLALATERLPEVIVYDYWLPDIDARSFLTQVREHPKLKTTKVVVCTATPESTLRQALGDLPFDGFISKPYRLSNFMQVIEESLMDR